MQLKAFIIFGLLLAGVCLTLAQEPLVTQPPPPIEFPAWKEIDRSEDVVEYSVTLPSPFETKFPENNEIPLRILVPTKHESPMPVVVLLHYWGARDLKVERALAGELNRRGVAAVMMALPYHLGRTPKGFDSGELAVQADPQAIIDNMTQSVLDVRRTIDFLATKPEFGAVGVEGTSLGAVVAALVYAIEPRTTLATFVLGGADIAHIIWNSSRVVREREMLRRRGYTEERLRQEIRVVEPLTYLRGRNTANAFVVGAKFDTVIPPASTHALIAGLDSPKTLFVDTGHYGGIFVQRRILREVAQYFGTQFGGKEYTPPSRIYAPTVRIGGIAGTVNGFNLAAGIDLVKFDPRAENFGSILITPRGPQVFLGHKIDSRISIGIIGSRTRVGFGLFWSTVL